MIRSVRFFVLTCLSLFFVVAKAQDSLSVEHLKPLTLSFNIMDGKLVGEGGDFLSAEMAKAQYTLLGDYIGSKRIPELTNALLPHLDQSGYTTMAAGIGPVITDILQCQYPNSIEQNLKDINTEHSFYEGERQILPIPDLLYEEDALFLQQALHQDWKLIGFGYDSWNGLHLLFDEMFRRLSTQNKSKHAEVYRQAKDELSQAYKSRKGNLLYFHDALKNSQVINIFIGAMSETEKNKGVVASYHHTMAQSYMHAEKMYFEKNKTRVEDEKKFFKEGIEAHDLDITKEKIFVKWDFNFLSRGLQPYAFYGLAIH